MKRKNEISRQARNDEDDVRDDEGEEELSEKEQKKLKQKESVEKRKNAKKKDKVARWGGLILLGLIMFVGFLLWVSGEMNHPAPAATDWQGSRNGSVIVK